MLPYKTSITRFNLSGLFKDSHIILSYILVEKAIQFIQAEKMFYETALIDTSELEKKLGEGMESDVTYFST